MGQVQHLAVAAFRARGFPDAGVEAYGQRMAWLEARGLPALMAMTAEFTVISKGRPWNERRPKPRADGQLVFDCPFIAGVTLADMMDQLVQPDPEDIRGIMGPSSPILLLPRIAEHAEKIGEPIEVFFKDGDPLQFTGQCVIDGERIVVQSDIKTLLFARGISLRRFGKPMPETAWGAEREQMSLGASWMLSLAEFIARDQTDARPDQ